jgi:AAA15 family ATPase/GTPase
LEEKLGCSIDSSIHVNEYGYSFVGDNVKTIPIMEYIQQVIYIDTPMIIGAVSALATDYWDDLDLLLQKKSIPTFKKAFSEMLENIIHGETSYDEDTMHMYRYHRMDGKVFDLFDSATGIKSFSILQMLLNNGSINKNTLLIIDEPEAHLHPQWIVEYARLIVLMHKHIGTKFFIASHSTDFVSAIKYIATKENCLESLSYYLSEEDKDNPYTYNYRSLNTDIEPIFESFNKSFSLIEEYGADNA